MKHSHQTTDLDPVEPPNLTKSSLKISDPIHLSDHNEPYSIPLKSSDQSLNLADSKLVLVSTSPETACQHTETVNQTLGCPPPQLEAISSGQIDADANISKIVSDHTSTVSLVPSCQLPSFSLSCSSSSLSPIAPLEPHLPISLPDNFSPIEDLAKAGDLPDSSNNAFTIGFTASCLPPCSASESAESVPQPVSLIFLLLPVINISCAIFFVSHRPQSYELVLMPSTYFIREQRPFCSFIRKMVQYNGITNTTAI
ncbi:unnamed protein product [Protopolystoma xenopodis]|uniref:Uncharacterized protein n=1 Tax=Protopolystoma xenopodis TaxID=117903 RepID=A0A448WTT8_9PLAT|nr:unnamed protein product [Protopolystoma xenopodis]